jgi:hypothetical protein
MMTLAAAAGYFDRTPVLDPDNGSVLFYAQIDPYDDSRRDAGAAYRRVMSVAPGTAMPAGRAVRVFGQVWLVGTKEIDGLAAPHRDKYVLQQAPGVLTVYRLNEFLYSSPDLQRWGAVEWQKDVKQIEVDSRAPEQCLVFLPAGSDVRPRDIVAHEGAALLVLETRDQPSGFRVATAVRLEQDVPGTALLTHRTYVPATGGFTEDAPILLQSLRVRWQSLFEYGSQADERFQEGDCSIVLPAGTAVTTKDRIALTDPATLEETTWAVVSVDELAGAVVAHARRA